MSISAALECKNRRVEAVVARDISEIMVRQQKCELWNSGIFASSTLLPFLCTLEEHLFPRGIVHRTSFGELSCLLGQPLSHRPSLSIGFTGSCIMRDSTDDSRTRAMKFLREEKQKLAVPTSSNFVQSSEVYGGRKSKMKSAPDTSIGPQPSSASTYSELTGLPMDLTPPSGVQSEIGRMRGSQTLPETNIGFRLLKKSGWKEGSGLGVSEQGRLNPVEAKHKLDRRGIGAEGKFSKRSYGSTQQESSAEGERETKKSKQEKSLAKKALKHQAEAERMQEAAFARAFYREFWPENM